jgi:glutamate racemase
LKQPVAIIDYGIGGLGLYKMIREEFPSLPIIYFSDSGVVPYGKQAKKQLRSRLASVFQFLFDKGVKKIIVACHSASSVVKDTDVNVIGLRKQTVRAVVKRRPNLVGIIGGGRTIRSGYYREELNKAGITTMQRVAQPLSILIERGETNTPEVEYQVSKIMRPLKSCSSILLACTHYPVLSEVILRHTPKGTNLIDPAAELYKSVRPFLKSVAKAKGKTEFLTTGNAQLMKEAARKAFGVKIDHAMAVKLTALTTRS